MCCVIINRQVGQGEIRVLQDESMDPLVLGAFFMHPDQGLSIAKEWVQVSDCIVRLRSHIYLHSYCANKCFYQFVCTLVLN